MEKKKVLVTYNMWRDGYAELMQKYDVTFPPDGVESFTYDEVLRVIADYDALQSMYDFPVDRRLMDAAPKLKIVSNYAVGYDNIDIPYATLKGIQVTNTPDPVTRAITSARRIHRRKPCGVPRENYSAAPYCRKPLNDSHMPSLFGYVSMPESGKESFQHTL